MALLLLLAAVYLALAIWLQRVLRRRMAPGVPRVLARSAMLGLFFSMSLIVGHGAAPFPALPILLACLTDLCNDMYGKHGWLTWVLLPMLVQIAIFVVLGLAFHGVRGALERMRRGRY